LYRATKLADVGTHSADAAAVLVSGVLAADPMGLWFYYYGKKCVQKVSQKINYRKPKPTKENDISLMSDKNARKDSGKKSLRTIDAQQINVPSLVI
jgi:hypothetical protein